MRLFQLAQLSMLLKKNIVMMLPQRLEFSLLQEILFISLL
ncbi:hypothetical protein EMIT0P260_70153 [Pseudomonas sp. IT-P260]